MLGCEESSTQGARGLGCLYGVLNCVEDTYDRDNIYSQYRRVDHPNVVVQLRHSPLAETRCEFDNRLFVYTLYLLLKYQWEHTPGRVYHTVCCRVLLMGLYAKYAPHDPHNASAEKPGELRLAAR